MPRQVIIPPEKSGAVREAKDDLEAARATEREIINRHRQERRASRAEVHRAEVAYEKAVSEVVDVVAIAGEVRLADEEPEATEPETAPAEVLPPEPTE